MKSFIFGCSFLDLVSRVSTFSENDGCQTFGEYSVMSKNQKMMSVLIRPSAPEQTREHGYFFSKGGAGQIIGESMKASSQSVRPVLDFQKWPDLWMLKV